MRGWVLLRDKPNQAKMPYVMERMSEVAQREDIELEFYQPEQFDVFVSQETKCSIWLEGQPIDLPDFALSRLGAEGTYFGYTLMHHLEQSGVRVYNSPRATELSRDKLRTQQILARHGIPVPRSIPIKHPINVELIEQELGFPVVVKTTAGAKGSGVYLSHSRSDFQNLMGWMVANRCEITNLIAQEFIKTSYGRDLRVMVIDGRVLGCIQRSSAKDNFKANISLGGSAQLHPVTPEISRLATETCRILGLEIAGIDLLFNGESFAVCEANSAPGFKFIDKCHDGLDIAQEILRYITDKNAL